MSPTFMDSLAQNPSGSGIYSSGGSPGMGAGDVLNLVNKLKDREMGDFKDKANFMSDLSLRQEARHRALFDPQKDAQQGQPQNVVFHDPNEMTQYQKGELGARQQGLNLESQRLSQQGKLGQEAIDVRTAQEKLNEQKNANIHEQKQADMQRKIEESSQKLELAQQALNSKNTNAEAQIQAHKDYQAAVEERHKLELAQKEMQFKESQRMHDEQIKTMQEKLKQGSKSTTTTEVNPEGTKKTVTTQKGSSSGTVKGIGKDGKEYQVPMDKIDDWNKNHAAPGTEIKQEE